jgi:hypothetical protein
MLLLAACVSHGLVEPGRTTVRGALSVAPSIAWNKRRQVMLIEDEIIADNPRIEVWTQNGTGIDQLVFYAGVEDGQPLVRGRMGRDMPRFRKDMSGTDVAQLFEAALTAGLGARDMQLRLLRPATFGGHPGFRLRLGFALEDEVEREASLAGAVIDEKLYMIALVGTRLHHHDLYLPEFERIAASARIVR